MRREDVKDHGSWIGKDRQTFHHSPAQPLNLLRYTHIDRLMKVRRVKFEFSSVFGHHDKSLQSSIQSYFIVSCVTESSRTVSSTNIIPLFLSSLPAFGHQIFPLSTTGTQIFVQSTTITFNK